MKTTQDRNGDVVLSTSTDCGQITIQRAALTADVSRALIGELNAELSAMYPEAGANHFRLDPQEVADGRGAFLVIYHRGTPVACGAVRLLDAQTAELKRMYVARAMRGKGLGRRLVAAGNPKRECFMPGGWSSKRASVRRPRLRCIEPPASSRSRSMANIASRRTPACVLEKT